MTALATIRQLDYTIVFARDMTRMRAFYAEVMRFPIEHELGPKWITFRVGSNLLALTERGLVFDDPSPPSGALSVQLAFRVAPADVDRCAKELADLGVTIAGSPTDQPWGHRTLFFRDPDGNVLEIYADI
jgi:catechol 2,3-dioxygenase-like lactoylglutathione lyase family enzyme